MTQEIDKALRSNSRKVSFRYELLNHFDIPVSDVKILMASISHNEFGAIKRVGRFILPRKLAKEIDFLSHRIKPYFVLHLPDGGTEEWPLGVFLLESPGLIQTGASSFFDVTGYDKTLILEQYAIQDRLFFQKGTLYTDAIVQIVNMAGIVDISISASEICIPVDIEFPVGTKGSDIAKSLLKSVNYLDLSADSSGMLVTNPYLPTLKRAPTKFYSSVIDSIITPNITEVNDIAGCPNVFIRVAENIDMGKALTSVIENEDINHPQSIPRRGRKIVDFARIREPMTQNMLDAYVHRKAVEKMSEYKYITFDTLNMPMHEDAEIIHLDMPELCDTHMKVHEVSWTMDLRPGGMMRHRCRAAMSKEE